MVQRNPAARIRGSRRLVVLWALALAMASAVMISASPSIAAPSPDIHVPTGTWSANCAGGMLAGRICVTDNAGVSYYMDSGGEFELEAEDKTDVSNVLLRWNNNTDLTVSLDSSPSFSGSAETDLIFQEGAFGAPDAVLGLTWCDDPVDGSTYRCDQAYTRMRGAGAITPWLAGHEAGHAFGLTHGAQAYPVMSQCDADLGIMRAAASCGTDPALGALVRDNIDWNF